MYGSSWNISFPLFQASYFMEHAIPSWLMNFSIWLMTWMEIDVWKWVENCVLQKACKRKIYTYNFWLCLTQLVCKTSQVQQLLSTTDPDGAKRLEAYNKITCVEEVLTVSFWATYLFRCLDPGRRAILPKIQKARSGGGLAHISTDKLKGCPVKAIIVLLVG